ncbi:MAG: thioredoxin domain-containing protein [Chloroflexi bacterium]|nr:thioredoxin domain-containing protein [Chloroflexota bacterium]
MDYFRVSNVRAGFRAYDEAVSSTGQDVGGGVHTNRLAAETSPYLLQHRHNPVDWYPWGPEALRKARDEDKPIFLSIGYAACHWCHVMERESFEDEATAADLNRSFVPVKVDREERPDLDAIYMDAVQAMTGQGGWPMSVFLTPDGKPFYGGTYYPDRPRHGMPSFRDVLAGVDRAWREQRAEVESAGKRLAGEIARLAGAALGGSDTAGGSTQDAGVLEAAMLGLERSFDATNGGWGGAPKFPQPMAIEFLLRQHARTSDARALAMARRSLDRMAAGGIHDQIGGGFHRYATDSVWLVPHFEKMLYDNGQLARVYLHAWQATGWEDYADVARRTLDYLMREMTTPEGAFASSQDADTEGEEGLTYVWSKAEIEEALGQEAPLFSSAFGVTERGNWEGRTIPERRQDDAELAGMFGTTQAEVHGRLRAAGDRLLERREGRPQPGRDDKVLAAWNGLAIAGFAEAGRALGEERYVTAARGAATFILDEMRTREGRLSRSWKDGRASHAGVLEDYTNLADGLLALYQASFEERWFTAAVNLMDQVLAHFAAPDGGFFDTADDHEELIARPRGLQDNAVPSGNSMAAVDLLRVAALTGEARYRDAAEGTLALVGAVPARYPTGFAQWLVAIGLALGPLHEVAIVGGPASAERWALEEVAFRGFRPLQVVAAASPGETAVPLLRDRPMIDGRATAYVCRGFACRQPVTDPAELAEQLTARA